MKNIYVFLIIISFFNCKLIAQDENCWYTIDFENYIDTLRITIDTINLPNNSWEIGVPNKGFFNGSFSPPNAILTNIDDSYPINDSSIFTIKHVQGIGFAQQRTAFLSSMYKVDCDTLDDFGIIEFSPDNGNLWYNILDDEIQNLLNWESEKPVFTGRSDWRYFSVNLARLSVSPDFIDTVLFKFTFISDENDSHRDGLMFDDIEIYDYYEGMNSFQGIFCTNIYPNPVVDWFVITGGNVKAHLQYQLSIYNMIGVKLVNIELPNLLEKIIIENLPGGIYIYHLENIKNHNSSFGKLIKK